jgi:PAS domain S-box-containing protein
MTQEETGPDKFANLRRRAESQRDASLEAPPGRSVDIDSLSPQEVRHLVHELQVHQIELDMQNDELRRTQRELEASRDRYADLYDFAPVGYFTLNEASLILEVNLTAAAMLGLERGHLIQQPLTRLILRQDQDIFHVHRRQLFATGSPQVCEIRLVSMDGSQFRARLEAIPGQSNEGQALCRVAVSDITQQARAKQQIESALAEKEELLKEVYHRVTNNLQALVYLIEIHAEQVVDPEVEKMLAVLAGQITALQQVHQKLYQSEDLVQIEIGQYLQELAINLLQALGGGRQISLHVDAAEHLVNQNIALVCGRIVNELVTNALKYAFPVGRLGERRIRIEFRVDESDYMLMVSDNGVGLPQGFDWRATQSMGLKLVDSWVTSQLEGGIELDSHTGTTFKISFPAPKNTS